MIWWVYLTKYQTTQGIWICLKDKFGGAWLLGCAREVGTRELFQSAKTLREPKESKIIRYLSLLRLRTLIKGKWGKNGRKRGKANKASFNLGKKWHFTYDLSELKKALSHLDSCCVYASHHVMVADSSLDEIVDSKAMEQAMRNQVRFVGYCWV